MACCAKNKNRKQTHPWLVHTANKSWSVFGGACSIARLNCSVLRSKCQPDSCTSTVDPESYLQLKLIFFLFMCYFEILCVGCACSTPDADTTEHGWSNCGKKPQISTSWSSHKPTSWISGWLRTLKPREKEQWCTKQILDKSVN